MGYEDFSAGQVFTSASADNLMAQSLIACTSGSRPASPAEGWHIYETDTDKIYLYSGSSWIQILNTSAWDSYTPTWNGTLGNGTLTGLYQRQGRKVTFLAYLRYGSTTTSPGGGMTLSLPATPHNNTPRKAKTGFVFDDSAGDQYPIWGGFTTSATMTLYPINAAVGDKLESLTDAGLSGMGGGFAQNDEVSLNGTYYTT